jgi:tripartite-type tricarboxylate transporter receptor subunit TctC
MTSIPRALKLVIGFSPGSLSDQIARVLADALQAERGITASIERRPGLNGVTAARAVAAAVPDGKTLFMATLGTHAIAPLLAAPAPYDPLRDFAPVALLTQSPMLLACHPCLGVRSVAGLIARARSNCKELTYATSAIGGAPHLAAELFLSLTGTAMRHVRYEETEQLYRDLEAGAVALSFNNIASMLPRCRRGALIALGVSSAVRSAAALDIPTIAEAGVPGYEMSNWTGIVAPAATPPAVAADLSAAIVAAMRSPRIARLLDAQGITPRGGSPRVFSEFMAAERARWAGVVARFQHVNAVV